jgi:hypothetical protein
VRVEFRLGRVDPAEDLLRPVGQHPARVGQPDPPPDPLHQPAARLRLQARQVVAHRRLRVVQRLRGRGDRAVAGDRDQHPQARHIQHINPINRNPR